jgi:hypothetical protein
MMRKSDLDCRILKFSKSDSRDLSSNQGKISKLNLFKNRKNWNLVQGVKMQPKSFISNQEDFQIQTKVKSFSKNKYLELFKPRDFVERI